MENGTTVYTLPPKGPIGIFSDPDGNFGAVVSPQYDNSVIIEIFNETRLRMIIILAAINLGIIVTSGFAGYFLAGKTLHPIELMVDEQKRFVADASHELRTPLTAIKSEIEVTLRGKKFNNNQAREILESNLEEVNKMQSLSNYLLALSKYQDGSHHISLESVDVKEAIKMAVEKNSASIRNKELTIEENLQPETVIANPESLVELFSILIDNAIKYSNKGSKIILTVRKVKKDVVANVQDYGVGIKAGDLPYIFNRFFRSDSSRNKTKIDGYGLGLSIAKSIVEMLKGKIDVTSEIDKGTTFTVTLPAESKKTSKVV
jgi:signal transduction histidine kinase